MLKKALVILLLLFITLSCACNNVNNTNVAAIVNGEIITKDSIKYKLELYEISRKNALEYLEKSDSFTDEQKTDELKKWETPKTYDSILNSDIENTVLFQEAKRLGITVDYDVKLEAEKAYSKLFDADLTEKEDIATRELIESYMKEKHLSKEDYINEMADDYYKTAMLKGLEEHYKNNLYGNKNNCDFYKKYSEYKQSLIKTSNIIIVNQEKIVDSPVVSTN